MNLAKFKKILPLIIILLIILAILLGVVIALNTHQAPVIKSPGINSDPGTGYNQSFQQDYQHNLQNPDPLQKLADLRPNLPYQGTNFKFEYDYPTNSYIVTYKKGQEAAGSAEFNNYLQQNSIQKKDIKNLVTKSG